EEGEEAPGGPLLVAGERRADPEAFGRVVETEADDQDDREADLVRRGGLTDREALGEVVQADAGGDEDREPSRRRHPDEVVFVLELGGRGCARAEEGSAAASF